LDENFNKILVIDLAYIGDLLMATPAISEIRRNYPGAYIAVLCSPVSSEVLRRNPDIDEIIAFEKESMGFWKLVGMGAKLRQMRFDVAFVFHRAFGSALLVYLAGIKRRIGFTTEGRKIFLTDRVKLDTTKHRAENDLAVLQAIGLDVNTDAGYVFAPDSADDTFPPQVLGRDVVEGGYVVLNPNASWETKRWPAARFKALAERIEKDLGLTTVGIGSADEAGVVDEILGPKGVNLAGRTDLSKLGVLCRDAAAVVTNDSGPMHVAAASGAKVIAIFGPTSPRRCGPRSRKSVVVRREGLECIACYKKQCPLQFQCMLEIGVDEIFGLVCETIGETVESRS
jgi:heptosyltransferase-2